MLPKPLIQQPGLRPVWALGVLLLSVEVSAQPVCSIDIGPDQWICQGESVTLNAPGGFNNYLWNTGETTSSIQVSNSGNYSVEVSYPTGELVTNGNFNGGNSGFGTQFTYSPLLQTDGNYFIGTNAATFHPQFVGTGNGNFLMVNSGWWHGGFEAWCQSYPVCPGQWYQLTFRGVSLADTGFPTLQWFVNDQPTWVDHQVSSQNNWQTFTTWWEAPAGVTWADFCIRVTSGNGVGNDFGLDDISISSTITLSDNVNVTVDPLPIVDLGENATLCTGESLVLDAAVPGGTYLWQDGSTNSSYLVNSAGNYNVTVTVNGCSSSDAMNVQYLPRPQVDLGSDQTLCEGEDLLLDVTTSGATYSWQDASSNATYTATTSGNYSVNVTVNGCTGSDDINLIFDPLPIVDLGPNRTICAGEVTTFDATTANATYLWQNGSTASTYAASSAGEVWVEVTVNGCSATDTATVILNPLPIVDLGADQTVCPGTLVTLSAALPGATYLWSNGSTGSSITTSIPGSYSVDVTVNGCTASDQVIISEYVLPDLELGPSVSFCEGSLIMIGTSETGSYLWNTGETSASIAVDQPGSYWLDLTENGCLVSDTIEVNEIPLPIIDLGPSPTVCPGDQAILDATISGGSYLWNTGETSPAINAASGQYSVDVTVNGCTASAAITVNEYVVIPIDLGNDTTLCPGETILLQAGGNGGNFLWQDGSSASSFNVNVAGNYSVEVTDANGCITTDAIIVSYADPDAVDLGSDQTICAGDQLVLDATLAGGNYLWNTGEMTSSITVNSAGNYSVMVTQGNCSVSDQVQIDVAPVPQFTIGNDTTLCPGEVLVLEVDQPGNTILWNTGSSTSSITVDQPGIYSATVTNASGCSSIDLIDVAYASPDAVDLGADVTLCEGEQILLDATLPGAMYNWSNGSSLPTLTISTSGTFWVEVSQGSCSSSDTIQVEVQPIPMIELGADASICEGEELLLDATFPNATYSWNNGSAVPTITVDQSGSYSVVVDLAGCTATDQITVSVIDVAEVDLGPDLSACADQIPILDATIPGASYSWNTGETSATIEAASSGIYWVEVSVGNCSASDTIEVSVQPVPLIDLGDDVSICEGEQIGLDASSQNATYTWNTGSTQTSIIVDQSGTYSVTADLNGCTASDEVTVTVIDIAEIDLGADVVACSDQTIVLDATIAGASYLWNTGATTATIEPTASGSYWVEVSLAGCSAVDSIDVAINPAPSVDLGEDQVLCEGDEVELGATWPGASYVWNTGAASASLTATTSGIYSVSVDLNGCIATDSVQLQFLSPPAIDLGEDVELCAGEELVLDATAAGDHLWNNGQTTPAITVSTSGIYSVQVTQGSCSASDTIEVQVNDPGSIDLGPDAAICEGESVQLDATLPGASYLWQDGSTDPIRTITASGIYSVTATVGDCAVSDSIEITVHTVPTVDLGPDLTICPNETASFDVATAGAEYIWQNGSADPTLATSSSGEIHVTVSIGNCSASDTVLVTVVDGAVADLGEDVVLCEGANLQLDVAQPQATYLWEDGSTDPQRVIADQGTYWVNIYRNDCVDSDTLQVQMFDPSMVDLGPDQQLCPGSAVTVEAPIAGAENSWSNGSTAGSITVSDPGSYWITVAIDGCVASDTIQFTMIDIPIPDLGEDRLICAGEELQLSIGPGVASVLWSTGATSDSISISEAGTYSVTLEVPGCTTSDAIEVEVMEPITSIDLGPARIICPDEVMEIDAELPFPAIYSWSNGAQGPILVADIPGVFTVEAEGNCIDATGTIVIVEGECGPAVHVPNSFTPNGDGINDRFNVVIDGEIANYRLEIYDRWGELIFVSTESADQGWDGTTDGVEAQDGVYVWKLRFRNSGNGPIPHTERIGHVTLLR